MESLARRKYLFKILLRWLLVALALERGVWLVNAMATPSHPVTPARLPIGWIAVVFTAAAVYFLLTFGWRSPLVWMAAVFGTANFLALLARSDSTAVLIALAPLAAAGGLVLRPGIGLPVLRVLARSLILGLGSAAAGVALSVLYAGLCSRAAPWVCVLTGALLLGVMAGLLCLSFAWAARILARPA